MLRRLLAYGRINTVSAKRNIHGFSKHTLMCLLRAGWVPGRRTNGYIRSTASITPPLFFHDRASVFLSEFGGLNVRGNFQMILTPMTVHFEAAELAELNKDRTSKFSLLGTLVTARSKILMESTGKVWAIDDDIWPLAESGTALIEDVCSGQTLGMSKSNDVSL